MDLQNELMKRTTIFNTYWLRYLQLKKPTTLYEASRYLPLAGGKRIRPFLTKISCESVFGDVNQSLPFAAGLELMHNFTLIVLFFGYTHCPDVCPTTLGDVALALRQLSPEQAARVQVLFVSVDPERDTPEMLKAYVPYFHPDFLGLLATPDEVAEAAREFRIVYRRHVEEGASGYLVDHTAGSYVLDAQGRLRLFLPFQPSRLRTLPMTCSCCWRRRESPCGSRGIRTILPRLFLLAG